MSADDPFARLGLPKRFAIDEAAIRDAQRRALARLHPDREPDPLRKATAMRESAAVSAAARLLLDPDHRASALLLLAGADELASKETPRELLMESLEWMEALVEARRTGDAAAVAAVREPIEARQAELLRALTEAIDGAPAAGTTDEGMAAPTPRESIVADPALAASLLTEFRIIRRLLEERAGAHEAP